MKKLICLIAGHNWHPAGKRHRRCTRCGTKQCNPSWVRSHFEDQLYRSGIGQAAVQARLDEFDRS